MFRQYRKPGEGEFIVVGVDTAAGGLDYCAAQFISTTKRDVPIVYHAKELASEMTPLLFDMLVRLYHDTGIKPCVAYERQNGGVFEIERLSRMNKAEQFTIYQTKTDTGTIRGTQMSPKLGWDTTTATRPGMLADLKEAIDHFYLTIYDRPTLGELLSFVVVQTTNSWKAQAENGMHDDLIMALAIAWQLYQTESIRRPHASIVTPTPPNRTNEAPIATREGLYDPRVKKMMEDAIKESTRPFGKDWRHR